MAKEEKQLLIQDISARLSYGVKATTTSNGWNGVYTITGYANNRIYLDCPVYDEGDDEWLVEFVKPYLRPLSSMTEEEKEDYNSKFEGRDFSWEIYYGSTDWLNAHHFDYRGLIEKGLALKATEGMYNMK